MTKAPVSGRLGHGVVAAGAVQHLHGEGGRGCPLLQVAVDVEPLVLRALEEDSRWAYVMWASIGVGLLLKGLIAALFPVAAGGLYLLFTR